MSNVTRVLGGVPREDKRISDMEPGDTGYTVPWAYSKETEHLDVNFTLSEKGGTASLWIECTNKGEYVIEFETPTYRNLLTGEMGKGH